jgi:hypothetical protein
MKSYTVAPIPESLVLFIGFLSLVYLYNMIKQVVHDQFVVSLFTDSKSQVPSTGSIPFTEGGINSGHTHNLAKFQSFRGLNFLIR